MREDKQSTDRQRNKHSLYFLQKRKDRNRRTGLIPNRRRKKRRGRIVIQQSSYFNRTCSISTEPAQVSRVSEVNLNNTSGPSGARDTATRLAQKTPNYCAYM